MRQPPRGMKQLLSVDGGHRFYGRFPGESFPSGEAAVGLSLLCRLTAVFAGQSKEWHREHSPILLDLYLHFSLVSIFNDRHCK